MIKKNDKKQICTDIKTAILLLIILLMIGAIYYIIFNQIKSNQRNNARIAVLSKQIETNIKATHSINQKIEKMNLIFQTAIDDQYESEIEREEAIAQPKMKEKDKKNEIAADMRVIEKFKNAIQNEAEIKSAELVNITGTKILLPINQKARNKNGKDYVKNILSKMKVQYSFDDYSVHITWSDGTEDTI